MGDAAIAGEACSAGGFTPPARPVEAWAPAPHRGHLLDAGQSDTPAAGAAPVAGIAQPGLIVAPVSLAGLPAALAPLSLLLPAPDARLQSGEASAKGAAASPSLLLQPQQPSSPPPSANSATAASLGGGTEGMFAARMALRVRRRSALAELAAEGASLQLGSVAAAGAESRYRGIHLLKRDCDGSTSDGESVEPADAAGASSAAAAAKCAQLSRMATDDWAARAQLNASLATLGRRRTALLAELRASRLRRADIARELAEAGGALSPRASAPLLLEAAEAAAVDAALASQVAAAPVTALAVRAAAERSEESAAGTAADAASAASLPPPPTVDDAGADFVPEEALLQSHAELLRAQMQQLAAREADAVRDFDDELASLRSTRAVLLVRGAAAAACQRIVLHAELDILADGAGQERSDAIELLAAAREHTAAAGEAAAHAAAAAAARSRVAAQTAELAARRGSSAVALPAAAAEKELAAAEAASASSAERLTAAHAALTALRRGAAAQQRTTQQRLAALTFSMPLRASQVVAGPAVAAALQLPAPPGAASGVSVAAGPPLLLPLPQLLALRARAGAIDEETATLRRSLADMRAAAAALAGESASLTAGISAARAEAAALSQLKFGRVLDVAQLDCAVLAARAVEAHADDNPAAAAAAATRRAAAAAEEGALDAEAARLTAALASGRRELARLTQLHTRALEGLAERQAAHLVRGGGGGEPAGAQGGTAGSIEARVDAGPLAALATALGATRRSVTLENAGSRGSAGSDTALPPVTTGGALPRAVTALTRARTSHRAASATADAAATRATGDAAVAEAAETAALSAQCAAQGEELRQLSQEAALLRRCSGGAGSRSGERLPRPPTSSPHIRLATGIGGGAADEPPAPGPLRQHVLPHKLHSGLALTPAVQQLRQRQAAPQRGASLALAATGEAAALSSPVAMPLASPAGCSRQPAAAAVVSAPPAAGSFRVHGHGAGLAEAPAGAPASLQTREGGAGSRRAAPPPAARVGASMARGGAEAEVAASPAAFTIEPSR